MVLKDRHRALMAAAGGVLPPAYRRVDYIKSTNNAYIQTDYTPIIGDELSADFMAESNANMICLFSAGTGSSQLIALANKQNTSSIKFYCKYFSTGSADSLNADNHINEWKRMTVSSDGTFTCNGISLRVTPTQALDGTATTLRIFMRRDGSNPFIGRLKSFKVTNNGMVKINLIPCIRLSDSVAGAYDTVSKTFYSSASNNAFVAG